MTKEILNFEDDSKANKSQVTENAAASSLNDVATKHRSHQEMQTTSQNDDSIITPPTYDNKFPNKKARMNADRRYMAYTGRRMPRVGDDYQVVDLPRLVEDDDDYLHQQTIQHRHDQNKTERNGSNDAQPPTDIAKEVSGRIRFKKSS